MLVSFTIENWKSFRDATSFTMEATGEDSHGYRVSVSEPAGIKVLPITAIFGGNASGKSNLIRALSFVQECVVGDAQGLDSLSRADPFRLDPEIVKKPTRFRIELLSKEKLYEFSFAVRRRTVLEEKLVQFSDSSGTLLYERKGLEVKFGESQEERDQLDLAAKAVRPDMLFLSECSLLGIPHYSDVFEWFSGSLVIIAPGKRTGTRILFENPKVYSTLTQFLPLLDTGISRIAHETIPLEHLSLPEKLRLDLEASVIEGACREIPPSCAFARNGVITREDGELLVKSMVTYHRGRDGDEVELDPEQVSGGTSHLLDIIPAIILLAQDAGKHVLCIDELDQNLHTNLTCELLEKYLVSCTTDRRSQLLFATHDTSLMDQGLLRHDEMWVLERNAAGASKLIAISGYKDLPLGSDIRKGYLAGHLGGVPHLFSDGISIQAAD